MTLYQVPEHLEIAPYQNRLRRARHGELTIRFGGGPLRGRIYHPTGVSGLWALIGTVASLEAPFFFLIEEETAGSELHGGFVGGKFCLFTIADHLVKVCTRMEICLAESPLVVLEDHSHGFVHWIPGSAMMSYEDFITVGNNWLLGKSGYAEASVLQALENWETGVYFENPADGKSRPERMWDRSAGVTTIQLPH